MRKLILAAALVALPLAAIVAPPVAAQATAPTITVGRSVEYRVTAPGTTRWRVSLRANTYYALGALIDTTGSVRIVLRDASGNTQAEAFYNDRSPVSAGGSFRARYSGDYFVTATAEARNGDASAFGRLFVNLDCASGVNTTCTVPVGAVRTDRQFDHAGDGDWFRTSLRAGRTYTVTLGGPARRPAGCVVLQAFGANGRTALPGRVTVRPDGSIAMSFTARANGRAFISASFPCDYDAPLYDIGLALQR